MYILCAEVKLILVLVVELLNWVICQYVFPVKSVKSTISNPAFASVVI